MSPSPQERLQARTRHRMRVVPALGCALCLALSVFLSRDVAGGDQLVANAVAKTNAFLASLDDQQRGKALFDFDSAKKPAWSNLPVTMVARNGLRLGELSKAQRGAALDAVAAVLSKEGFQKVLDIMNADDQLVKGKENKLRFGTENYYLAIFGNPSATRPWMVQFGGHHLGINVTVVGKETTLTPTHTGTQPDVVTRDGKSVRPLGPENDLAFKLVNQLSPEQRQQAVLGAKPKNLILGPGQDGKTIAPEGLKCAVLKEDQRAVLLDLIGAWVHIMPADAAGRRLTALRAKIDDTYFAWYGPTTNGSAAYYRIQGPTLLIEYAPQGSTNHIHTIIRDPSNDYGKAWAKS